MPLASLFAVLKTSLLDSINTTGWPKPFTILKSTTPGFCKPLDINEVFAASPIPTSDTYRGKNEKIGDVCWRARQY